MESPEKFVLSGPFLTITAWLIQLIEEGDDLVNRLLVPTVLITDNPKGDLRLDDRKFTMLPHDDAAVLGLREKHGPFRIIDSIEGLRRIFTDNQRQLEASQA